MTPTQKKALITVLNDPALLEIGRVAVEDALVDLRDDRISVLRRNGLVIHERDGSPSTVIRMGTETALVMALKAIVAHG